jgi:beta-mannosidase
MGRILTIDNWQAVQYDASSPDHIMPVEKDGWFPVRVPGAIQYDLAALGKIENLYAGTKAAFDCAWVAKSDWLYRGEFDTPAEAASPGTLILRFKGIDTFSELWLNGVFLGDTFNAMRVWDFPLEPGLLVPSGKNVLLARVKAHDRMVADKVEEAKKRLKNGDEIEGTLGKALIRRYQRSFFNGGSSLLNLGTGVLGIGINREVELLGYPGAWFSDFFYRTEKIEFDGAGEALRSRGKIFFTLENAGKAGAGERTLKVTVSDAEGRVAASMEGPVKGGEGEIPLLIDRPGLWWPAGYGEPYLYRIRAELLEDGKTVDRVDRQIGVRTVELVKKDPGGKHTFYFKVNGRKVLIHGQNHIPLDYIKCYAGGEEYDRLFKLLKNQNVNLVRIWGGGVVEEDSYYDRCDKAGMLVWHDMFLHSNTYPDYDPEFVENFMAEAEGILRATRPHPCLALICGGNEQQEGWDEWGWKGSLDRFYGEKLFNELLPPLAAKLCPDLPYIPNSPHGGADCQSPAVGECHNWGNFYNSTKDPLFVTETCWTHESYSRPETLKKYMGLDVDAPEWNSLGWPVRWRERTRLGLHNRMPYSSWFSPESLRSYLRNLELEQFRADYSALSEYRYRSPSNAGVVYWSFNKGGPLFQFGCVDYGGYPLMSYYAVKRIFKPLGVYAYRDVSDVVVMLSNHSAGTLSLRVEIRHLDKRGRELGRWIRDCEIRAGGLLRAARLEDLYGKVRSRLEETVYVAALRDGKPVAEDMLFFCPFREYQGEYGPLDVKTEKTAPDTWRIRLSTESPARLVELESNRKMLFTDNYFPLVKGGEKVVEAILLEGSGEGPVELSAGILGGPEARTLTLA